MPPERVYIRNPEYSDRREFLAMTQGSRRLHDAWIAPPLTETGFDYYIERTRSDDHEGFLVCGRADHTILGVVNINNVVRGSFLSGSLGYYVNSRFAGQGFMRQGLGLVIEHAFGRMGLHRLEANIQHHNTASINLVKRCGFHYEGISPRFLYIDGAWRDHERWAFLDERDTLTPPPSPR